MEMNVKLLRKIFTWMHTTDELVARDYLVSLSLFLIGQLSTGAHFSYLATTSACLVGGLELHYSA